MCHMCRWSVAINKSLATEKSQSSYFAAPNLGITSFTVFRGKDEVKQTPTIPSVSNHTHTVFFFIFYFYLGSSNYVWFFQFLSNLWIGSLLFWGAPDRILAEMILVLEKWGFWTWCVYVKAEGRRRWTALGVVENQCLMRTKHHWREANNEKKELPSPH